MLRRRSFFFFNDTATTEIYTLSLHDALPIYSAVPMGNTVDEISAIVDAVRSTGLIYMMGETSYYRSEEHTSELQSQSNLVCRLLLEKKKTGPRRRRRNRRRLAPGSRSLARFA